MTREDNQGSWPQHASTKKPLLLSGLTPQLQLPVQHSFRPQSPQGADDILAEGQNHASPGLKASVRASDNFIFTPDFSPPPATLSIPQEHPHNFTHTSSDSALLPAGDRH